MVSAQVIEQFESLLGQEHVLAAGDALLAYGIDMTHNTPSRPEVVLKPESAEAVAAILKLCNAHGIPVTPRGGGTGLAGGAIPIRGGAVVSMERMNRILHIDPLNLQATVEPGVITETFQETVREKGLFYPPDPASKGSCFLGGNLANNSGGPKAVKYGVTRDYVINLEVALPSGELIWTGANVLKNSTGYSLTQLMCGSEGTLGIITKIVFKLRGYPQKEILILAPFPSNEEACRAVAAVFIAGVVPSGMEFFEREAGERAIRYCAEAMGSPVATQLPSGMEAFLLCELDGNDAETLARDAERALAAMEPFGVGEALFADSIAQREELWKIRRNISPAIAWTSENKSEDVVAPRYNLPKLVSGIKAIGRRRGFNTVCFGHLGDGNLHVNILRDQLDEVAWATVAQDGIRELFELTIALGGTLSGEHGIGIEKRPYMPLAMAETNLALMRGIKKVFDPNGILNPGKIF